MKKKSERHPSNPPNGHYSSSSYNYTVVHEFDGSDTKYRQKRDYSRWRQDAPWEIYVGREWWQLWKSEWKEVTSPPFESQ